MLAKPNVIWAVAPAHPNTPDEPILRALSHVSGNFIWLYRLGKLARTDIRLWK